MIRRTPLLLLFGIAFPFSASLFGQSLQVSVTANGASTTIFSGGSLTLTGAGIGQATPAFVTIMNAGSSAVSINSISVTGTSEITLQSALTTPFTLNAGASTSITIQYLPASGNAVTASVAVNASQGSQSSAFQFSLIGVSPRLTYNYSLASSTSLTPLNAGDTISFPTTNVGSTAVATVNVLNSGSAGVTLNSTGVTGGAFQLPSSPAPVFIAAGQQVSLSVQFAPTSTGTSNGFLTLTFSSTSVTFTLLGAAASPSFSLSYTLADGNAHALTPGVNISFPSVDINASTGATITIANQGGASGTVSSVSVSGAGFQPSGLPPFPATVAANQSLRFGIVFAPTQSGSFTGTFTITYTNGSVSGTLSASTSPSNISVDYIDPATNNTVPLPNNSTLPFPNTLIGSTSTITVIAPNTGTGTGSIGAITISGTSASAFQLLNLPPFPVSVPPNQQSTFGIRFTPQQQQTYTATLTVTINGQPMTVNLSATGTGPQFSYTVAASSGTVNVSPNGTITLPGTNVGQTTSATITVLNSGTGNGQIAGVTVSGQGLSVASLPTFPLTLAPNASQQFTLNFAPTQPGNVTGQLIVGGAIFTVTATAVGSQLVYSYANAAGTTTVAASGSVIFAPLAVGSTESVTFAIQNNGTSAATISNISAASTSGVFSIPQTPSLPLSLAPGANVSFTVNFAPNNTGALTGVLAVDTFAFNLSGTGTPPPALPSYQFQGPGGTLTPSQQPTLGLTLASPYSLPLQGTLTLSFVSSVFADDPSVQFATGGRTVNFTIPANSTTATFSGNTSAIMFQTGTTAGSILIAPSFTLQGGFNVTPSRPQVLTLTVPRSSPQLTSATVTSVTPTTFTLVLNGYSTTRVLSAFNVQFTPATGANISTTALTISASTPSATWFQSSASQAFGGSFLVQIPFTLQGGSGSNLVSLLQSLGVTATNDAGTSSSISVAIH